MWLWYSKIEHPSKSGLILLHNWRGFNFREGCRNRENKFLTKINAFTEKRGKCPFIRLILPFLKVSAHKNIYLYIAEYVTVNGNLRAS